MKKNTEIIKNEVDEYFNFISEDIESNNSIRGSSSRSIVDLLEGLNESKIIKGVEFKNYKEMCMELSIKPKAGNSKAKQMKELEVYYFDYTQQGHKIKITKVHNLNDFQKRVRTLKVSYKDYIEELIISLMIDDVKGREANNPTKEDKLYDELIVSQGQLAKAISVVNKNYSVCMFNKGTYSHVAGYNKDIVDDWSNSFQGFLKRAIKGAIQNLRDRRLIIYEMRYSVCEYNTNDLQKVVDKDGDEYLGFHTNRRNLNIRLATHEEKRRIVAIEKESLIPFGVGNIRELFETHGMEGFNKYKDIITNRLINELQIQSYFLSYALSFDDEIIKNYAKGKDIDFGLTIRAKQEYSTQMNNMIVQKINLNATNRHNKAQESKNEGRALKEIENIRIKDDYIKTCESITTDVIDTSCKKNYYNSIKNRKSQLDAQRERINTSESRY